MLDDIFIFDNIISKEKQDILEKYVKKENLKWIFANNISYFKSGDVFPQYVLPPTYEFDSNILDIISEIEQNVCIRLGRNFLKNYRFKINLLKVSDYEIAKPIQKGIHIDRNEEHISLVYYINDTDGSTSFYDFLGENVLDCVKYVDYGRYDKFKLVKEIPPKKGRVSVFNGMMPHHSNYPTINDRYVININLVIDKKLKTKLV